MDADFAESIKQWVALDNKVKAYNDAIKEVRSERNEIGDKIMEYVDTSGLSNSTVKISDGKLRFAPTKQHSPLSLGYVEECLHQCLGDQKIVKQIMNHIKKNRNVKVSRDIKRSYSDK